LADVKFLKVHYTKGKKNLQNLKWKNYRLELEIFKILESREIPSEI